MISDNPERSRFEIHDDGRLAGVVEYRIGGDEIELRHTEIGSEFSGRGLAGRVVRGALDAARTRGLTVVPTCEFACGWIGRHPEHLDVVSARWRQRCVDEARTPTD